MRSVLLIALIGCGGSDPAPDASPFAPLRVVPCDLAAWRASVDGGPSFSVEQCEIACQEPPLYTNQGCYAYLRDQPGRPYCDQTFTSSSGMRGCCVDATDITGTYEAFEPCGPPL